MEVSIIIPIYNAEKYLARCLDSVLKQTYKDFELILLNDQSPDNSHLICEEYAKQDKRIRYILNEKNLGVSATRNKGIELSVGKFIVFCDDDDIVSPQWLEHQLSYVQADVNVLPICAICANEEELGEEKVIRLLDDTKYDKSRYYLFNQVGIAGYIWNTIYSRAIVEKNNIRFPVRREMGDINEDLIFSLKYAQCIRTVVYTGYCDYCHTKNNTNHSTVTDDKWYFEKYQEKYNLWKEYINTNIHSGIEQDILYLGQKGIYHFLHSLQIIISFNKGIWQELKYFKRVVCSNEMQDALTIGDLSAENKHIINILKKKNYILLWLIYKYYQLKNR